MRFVPIENVFIEVQNEMGEDWQGEQPAYQNWIKDAQRRIYSKVTFDKVIEVLPVNKDQITVDLCPDTVGIKALLQGDKKKELADVFSNSCQQLNLPTFVPGSNEFGNGFFIVGHDIKRETGGVRYVLRDGQIQFMQKVTVDKVTVLSQKHKRDKNGNLMVAQSDVMACAYYILQILARRSRWKQKEHRMSLQDVATYDLLFTNNLMDARAEGAKLSQTQEYERSQMMSFRNTSGYNEFQ